MKHMKKTIIHLGAHKTGTTLIQNWMAQNSATLSKNGIGVSRNIDLAGGDFEQFCFEHSKPRIRTISIDAARTDIRRVRNNIGCPDSHIISKENILGEAGRLYINSDNTLFHLNKIFNYDNTMVIFYIRRIDEFIESHVLQQYAHGNEISIEDVLESIGNRTWADVVESIERHFHGRFCLEFYERIKHGIAPFLKRFCGACNIEPDIVENTEIPTVEDQNRSISDTGITILKRIWTHTDVLNRPAVFKEIQKIHHTGVENRPRLLNAEQRNTILTRHKESHDFLVKNYADDDDFIINKYRI